MKKNTAIDTKKYLENVILEGIPMTEEQFFCTLEFRARELVRGAMVEYEGPILGIIPYSVKIDWKKAVNNFNRNTLTIIDCLVELACVRFGLSRESDAAGKTFEKWFNKTAEKYGRKVRYDEAIFNNNNSKDRTGRTIPPQEDP